MKKSDNDFTPLDLSDLGKFEPKIVGRDTLSSDDISILHDLERKNNITYNDTYVSEFLKCRNNLFYFIHNYCYIGEVGNPLLYSSDIMNRKYRRVIKSLNKYKKIILMASRQLGKALDLDTLIPTPCGFKKLRDLQVGDIIFNENGEETKIIAESPIFYDKKTYRVSFDNQTAIIASEDHLWNVNSSSLHFKNRVMNTVELKEKVECPVSKRHGRPYIDINKPIRYKKKELLIPPYILGLWLGDGHSDSGRITAKINDASELMMKLKNNKYELSEFHQYHENSGQFTFYKLKTDLQTLNLLKNKHIPEEYLTASIYQRIQLLRGLMDTDGSVSKKGDCEFYQKNKNFINSFITLLSSLGIKSRIRIKTIKDEKYYTVKFSTKRFYVFNLSRKRVRQKNLKNHKKNSRIYVTDIQEINTIPCKCIMVDSPSSLFLAGDKMIPTHNSTLAACIIAHTITFFPGIRSVLFNMDQGAGIENIDKLKFILANLPDWMKFLPDKFVKKTYVELTNGSKASVFYPSTIKSPDQIARSLTIPCLYVDEAAFIPHIERIWMSAQPTLSTASMQADKYGYPSWSVLTSTVRHVL